MGNLKMPKHTADLTEIQAALKVYCDAGDWLSNSDYIDQIKIELGQPYKTDESGYTRITQILSYFGLVTWQDMTKKQSNRKITESGDRFYNAWLNNDWSSMHLEILLALETLTFGRNVCGTTSDSDFEPPNIFIKCIIILGYVKMNEYKYLLDSLDAGDPYTFCELLSHIQANRYRRITAYPAVRNSYISDPKPINVLENWRFVSKDSDGKYTLDPDVMNTYLDRLLDLKINNSMLPSGNPGSDDSDEIEKLREYNNLVLYGPPGTGKSFLAKKISEEGKVYKVTFHPDFDNRSFVGGYKPSMNGDDIVYKFVPQIFIKTYVDAWKNLASGDEIEIFYLVIDEINRGNCAEIFGNIFQLLDRNKDGFSVYPVIVDEELKKHLLGNDGFGGYHQGITEKGEIKLPSNLKIIATMNTSDQSLYPMDSAFKRRWDWHFVPIDYSCRNSDFKIRLNSGKEYSWLDFIKSINSHIFDTTRSQDKQIGNWFIDATPSGKKISETTFINKVIFYLWNDIYRDEDSDLFKDESSSPITYSSFFEIDKRDSLLESFLEKRLTLNPID